MAKVMTAKVKLQCPGGQATPAPPVGPALGQHGVNIGQFVMQFNERTKEMKGTTIPVEITIYSDRSFEFITKSPPAAVLLKQAAGIASGSAEPHKVKVGDGHARPGQEDRRDQVQRPQRPRHRPRLPDHRRHGAEHGRRDQGLNPVTIQQVRHLYDAQPFQPFVIHLADGRNVPVHHREFLASSPSGRTVIVYQPDDSFNVIDLLLVTDLEVKPTAAGSGRRRKT